MNQQTMSIDEMFTNWQSGLDKIFTLQSEGELVEALDVPIAVKKNAINFFGMVNDPSTPNQLDLSIDGVKEVQHVVKYSIDDIPDINASLGKYLGIANSYLNPLAEEYRGLMSALLMSNFNETDLVRHPEKGLFISDRKGTTEYTDFSMQLNNNTYLTNFNLPVKSTTDKLDEIASQDPENSIVIVGPENYDGKTFFVAIAEKYSQLYNHKMRDNPSQLSH